MRRTDRWVEGYRIPHDYTTPDKYRLRQQVGALNRSGIRQQVGKESVTPSLTPSPPLSFDTGTLARWVEQVAESAPKSQRDELFPHGLPSAVVDDSLCPHKRKLPSWLRILRHCRTARFTSIDRSASCSSDGRDSTSDRSTARCAARPYRDSGPHPRENKIRCESPTYHSTEG